MPEKPNFTDPTLADTKTGHERPPAESTRTRSENIRAQKLLSTVAASMERNLLLSSMPFIHLCDNTWTKSWDIGRMQNIQGIPVYIYGQQTCRTVSMGQCALPSRITNELAVSPSDCVHLLHRIWLHLPVPRLHEFGQLKLVRETERKIYPTSLSRANTPWQRNTIMTSSWTSVWRGKPSTIGSNERLLALTVS